MPKKMTKKYKNSAIICELNPLHMGHKAIFDYARDMSEGIICILSGNFVQRGEPAILDKWARCRLALENGADLVIELPLPWACAGAERFAHGAVYLANALGNIDSLVFGSEITDINAIKTVAKTLLSKEFSERFSDMSDDGSTFATRREYVLNEILGEEVSHLLQSPNAILGIEYIKALIRENSNIVPVAFGRLGANHDTVAVHDEFRSASELRELIRAGKAVDNFVPNSTAITFKTLISEEKCPADIRLAERAVLCTLRTMSAEEFAVLPDISEGLENRLYNAARQAKSLEDFYASAKSKRYTHARLRRLAMSAFLGISNDLPALPPYIRVLGMSKLGEEILKNASPALPIVARPADVKKLGCDAQKVFNLETHADDIYSLCCPNLQPCGRDFTEKIIKI